MFLAWLVCRSGSAELSSLSEYPSQSVISRLNTSSYSFPLQAKGQGRGDFTVCVFWAFTTPSYPALFLSCFLPQRGVVRYLLPHAVRVSAGWVHPTRCVQVRTGHLLTWDLCARVSQHQHISSWEARAHHRLCSISVDEEGSEEWQNSTQIQN